MPGYSSAFAVAYIERLESLLSRTARRSNHLFRSSSKAGPMWAFPGRDPPNSGTSL